MTPRSTRARTSIDPGRDPKLTIATNCADPNRWSRLVYESDFGERQRDDGGPDHENFFVAKMRDSESVRAAFDGPNVAR
jgi:hypothetical protein